MEFTFQTTYNRPTMTALARALRKTTRKKRNRRAHLLGWIAIALGLMLSLPLGGAPWELSYRTFFTWVVLLILLAVLLWEDALNGYLAVRRLPPNTQLASTTFTDSDYRSVTGLGESRFHYDNILALAETEGYFILIFSQSHAQAFDKHTLSGGTVDAFRSFLEEKTGKVMQKV